MSSTGELTFELERTTNPRIRAIDRLLGKA